MAETPAPDYSVLLDDRLVAYLWRCEAGAIRRAGAQAEAPLAPLTFADVLLFDMKHAPRFVELGAASADFDALLFKIGLEGFQVVAGAAAPDARRRRF
ncbi:MAG: hypothetical protein HY903_11510 [Deltaproteobacteria bacterium]|nr:hypothetical protein [Deltaproteobacteria bacterium]